jgi:hypothetical protein
LFLARGPMPLKPSPIASIGCSNWNLGIKVRP